MNHWRSLSSGSARKLRLVLLLFVHTLVCFDIALHIVASFLSASFTPPWQTWCLLGRSALSMFLEFIKRSTSSQKGKVQTKTESLKNFFPCSLFEKGRKVSHDSQSRIRHHSCSHFVACSPAYLLTCSTTSIYLFTNRSLNPRVGTPSSLPIPGAGWCS